MLLLEELKLLDRASEDLPTAEEIGERRRAGRGMERPELAILSPTPSACWRARWRPRTSSTSRGSSATCAGTSRPRSSSASATCSGEHPLRRQLICMVNSNAVVNALGPTFMSQLVAERGAEPADVVRAFRIAREVTGADARWEVVERLEGASREAQLELMGGVDALVDATTRWYLTWAPEGDIEATIAAGRDGFERLAGVLGSLGSEERRRRREVVCERLVAAGVPEPLARAHALRPELRYAPDMVWVAGATGRPIEEVARGLLRRRRRAAPGLDRGRARARPGADADAALGAAGRARGRGAGPPRARRAACSPSSRAAPLPRPSRPTCAERRAPQRRFTSFLRSLSREGEPDLAGLTLAVRQLRALAG